MKDALIVSVLSVLPRNRGAQAMGWFARSGASRLVTRAFVAAYGVDLDEAEGELADYPTLEALFTRKLKDGVRPVDPDPEALVSPVDGRCAAVGETTDGRIEIADGKELDIASLTGAELDGEVDVAVLYLSPTDYHRVHSPVTGEATRWAYTPGTLWPVFPAAVRRVDGLFSRNERWSVRIETPRAPVDVVLVGAFGVGRITSPLCDIVTNTGLRGATGTIEPPAPLTAGAELGTFHLGSTVILIAPPGCWTWGVEPGQAVRMGRAIARGAQ